MKKLFLSILIGLFLICNVNVAQAETKRNQIITAITLDDSPTSVTSSAVNAEQSDSIGFFVDYDETEVGETLTADVTIQISYDGTTWIAGRFFDLAGGPATFQTTESIASDGTYFFWLHKDSNVSRVRVIVTGNSTDSDDTIVIDAFVVINQ